MAPIHTSHRALLLLPGLSLPLNKQSLRTAYKQTLESLLSSLSKQLNGKETSRLDIVIILPEPFPTDSPSCRTENYSNFQTLIGQVYTLVCIVAAQQHVDLDIPGGLDVRIILLNYSSTSTPEHPPKPLSGPLTNFQALISSLPTSTVFCTPESESGISLSSTFTQFFQTHYSSTPTFHRLPCGPSVTHKTSSPQAPPPSSQTPHHSVAVGGTFDHLHIGHKLLLTFTIFLASPVPPNTPRKITIGITTDSLLANKKHSAALESWETRQQRTAEFVESILVFSSSDNIPNMRKQEVLEYPGTPNPKVVRVTYSATQAETTTNASPPKSTAVGESDVVINYTQITDPFGPTITDEDISALVISAETRAGGKAVNDKRKEKGWRELEVFEVDVLDTSPVEDEDEGGKGDVKGKVKEGFESKISSTEIRRRMLELEQKLDDGGGREREGGKL